ncbi:hypothetical protein CROQUDRAFT_40074 [Cronartium quercuum f. sp. fusiforme G11]|uniref:Transposase n=1 Tax=Cronartium quercuum f. sp. fusiforme G11 TaxID=708437 RepID=A0A9P6NTJ2_9BASI|nr:hypothetical protein CROQUDRAFT_40074 [Cronartium quercuum f. sp. fusiforme G11]
MVQYSPEIKNTAAQMFIDGSTRQEINETLRTNISLRTLMRWKALYRTTQSAVRDPATYERRGRPSSFSEVHLQLLADIIHQSPSMYLDELQEKMFDLTGIWVTLSTLSRVLHQHLGLSLLVSRALDRRQCPVARAAFVAAVHRIPADYFVFIGEQTS